MRRILILVVAGLVLGAAGAETYRRLHERTAVVATPATGEAKTAEVDHIADGDVQAAEEQFGEAKSGISVTAWRQGASGGRAGAR